MGWGDKALFSNIAILCLIADMVDLPAVVIGVVACGTVLDDCGSFRSGVHVVVFKFLLFVCESTILGDGETFISVVD